ncbi:hypothetical protein E4T39_02604 [Aureobasidium subglaciale]|nr:hypothetical protein E4T39_02604 [Aureobasidium subglaciale]
MSEVQPSTSEAVAALAERTALIRTLVQERLHREVSIPVSGSQSATDCMLEVETVSTLGRDSNNFVHLVQLKKSELVQCINSELPLQHGTHKLDHSVTRIVVRISNPYAQLDEEVRVENEVAAITLMRRALAGLSYSPVPKVFAWETSGSIGNGWIAEEFMEGEKLSSHLSGLSGEQKAQILEQIAEISGMIQAFDPEVDGFGGLAFDENGRVVVGRSSLWSVGPFLNYADMYQGIFKKQLELVATTPFLNDWTEGGLKERLCHFDISGRLRSLLQPFENMRPTLVHGDISAENILINPKTHQITGLLDFDFSHIASEADEFFYSFMDFGGLVTGPFEGGDFERLRNYQIHGFPDLTSSEDIENGPVDWNAARLWQAAQQKHNVHGPADIERITELADIYWFLMDVCPPFFNMPRWLAKRTEEQKQATKAAIGTTLGRYLSGWGY